VVFDIRKLKEESVDLVPALEASLAKVAAAPPQSETIAINPPPVRPRKRPAFAPPAVSQETPTTVNLEDLAAELQTCVDTCNGAIARIDRLLAQLRAK
jgi:hypothetical protein